MRGTQSLNHPIPSTLQRNDAIKDILDRRRVLDVVALERDAIFLIDHRDNGKRNERAPLLEVAEIRLRLDLIRWRVVKLSGEVIYERIDVPC